MPKRKSRTARISAAVFAVIFACIVLGSLAFTAVGASHDCHGEDCGICAVMQTCTRLLNEAGVLPAAGCMSAAAAAFTAFLLLCAAVNDRMTTPVTLKVKLLI